MQLNNMLTSMSEALVSPQSIAQQTNAFKMYESSILLISSYHQVINIVLIVAILFLLCSPLSLLELLNIILYKQNLLSFMYFTLA